MSKQVSKAASNRLAKASFLSALLVVALHVGIGPKWVGKAVALTGIAVPFFFVAAGYLFAGRMGEPGWYLRQVKSRVKSLLVPYVFWNVAYWCFVVGLTVMLGTVGVKYGGLETLDGLMWRRWDILGVNPISFPTLGLLWFVRCLFVIALVSPVFLLVSRKWGGAFLLLGYTGMVWFGATHPEPEQVWMSLWLVKGWMRAVVYFGLGVWIRFNGGEDLRVPRSLAVVVLIVGWGTLAWGNVLASSLAVPITMWGLWYSLSDAAWPKGLTSCSFPIYVLHAFWGTVAAALISAVGLKAWAADSALAWLIKWGIMVAGPLVTVWMMRRFMPRVGGVVFGGR